MGNQKASQVRETPPYQLPSSGIKDQWDVHAYREAREDVAGDMSVRAVDYGALCEGIASSAIMLVLYTPHSSLEEFMEMSELPIQMGIGIYLDKPMLILVDEGVTVPRKIRQVADKIVTVDFKDKEGAREVIQRAHEEFIRELGLVHGKEDSD